MNNADSEGKWFWMCCKCGLDIPYQISGRVNRKGYDEYWSKAEDSQAYMELDLYFNDRFPEFKS